VKRCLSKHLLQITFGICLTIPAFLGAQVTTAPKSQSAYRLMTPCEAITRNAYPHDMKYIPSRLVLAEEIEGHWLGGRVQNDIWEPGYLTLTCDGTQTPFYIDEQLIKFPLKQTMDAPMFSGVYADDTLTGELENDPETDFVFYKITKQPIEDVFDYNQLYDAGTNKFSYFGKNSEGENYFFDGESARPLIATNKDEYLTAGGDKVSIVQDPFFPKKQIQSKRFDQRAVSYPSIEKIKVKEIDRSPSPLPGYVYTTINDKIKPVIVLDQAITGLSIEEQKMIHFQLVGIGYHLISPTGLETFQSENSFKENWNQRAIDYAKYEYALDEDRVLFLQWGGTEPKVDLKKVIGLCWFQEQDIPYPQLPENVVRLMRIKRHGSDSFFDNGRQMILNVSDYDSLIIQNETEFPEIGMENLEINQSLMQSLTSWARACTPSDPKEMEFEIVEPFMELEDGTTITVKEMRERKRQEIQAAQEAELKAQQEVEQKGQQEAEQEAEDNPSTQPAKDTD